MIYVHTIGWIDPPPSSSGQIQVYKDSDSPHKKCDNPGCDCHPGGGHTQTIGHLKMCFSRWRPPATTTPATTTPAIGEAKVRQRGYMNDLGCYDIGHSKKMILPSNFCQGYIQEQ